MNATKKTLTTLSVAATLALGGIAVAQTTGSVDSSTGVQSSGSDSSLMNNANNNNSYNSNSATPSMNGSAPGTAPDTSTLGAGPAEANQQGSTTYNDTSTLGNNSDGSLGTSGGGLAPQADRN